jgi:hypothetical protein
MTVQSDPERKSPFSLCITCFAASQRRSSSEFEVSDHFALFPIFNLPAPVRTNFGCGMITTELLAWLPADGSQWAAHAVVSNTKTTALFKKRSAFTP